MATFKKGDQVMVIKNDRRYKYMAISQHDYWKRVYTVIKEGGHGHAFLNTCQVLDDNRVLTGFSHKELVHATMENE